MIDDDRPRNTAETILEKVTEALLRTELQRGFPSTDVELPPRDHERWAVWRNFARTAITAYTTHLEGQPHHYLSTGCLHGEHGYCQSNTGSQGQKIPATCKFCGSGCVCPCHEGTGAPQGITVVDRIVNPRHQEEQEEFLTALNSPPVCMTPPPGQPGEVVALPDGRTFSWGDCDCTKPLGHEGDHACEPCTQRFGAPTWSDFTIEEKSA